MLRFEAAKLVMQWLCNHEDQNMQRMAVAIISILAAKVNVVVGVVFIFVSSHLSPSSHTYLIFGAAVHRADGPAGSGDVHSEGELLASAPWCSLTCLCSLAKKRGKCSLTSNSPAATASHRASEGHPGHGGRHPQVYSECPVEPHGRVADDLPPFY